MGVFFISLFFSLLFMWLFSLIISGEGGEWQHLVDL